MENVLEPLGAKLFYFTFTSFRLSSLSHTTIWSASRQSLQSMITPSPSSRVRTKSIHRPPSSQAYAAMPNRTTHS